MMRAVQIQTLGVLPERLSVSRIPIPKPSFDELLVRNTKTGLNFIDTYHRSGLYKKSTPFVLGVEGVGICESTGEGSTDSSLIGKRVGYFGGSGSYCEYTVVPREKAFVVPDVIEDNVVVACITQGLTAHYLATSTFPLAKHEGSFSLIHAAAGGTGRLLVQLAKLQGAKVIGTCSTKKIEQDEAYAVGAHFVIDYKTEKVVEKVKEITDKRGVDVCYDGVGKQTWEDSLSCVKNRGTCVFFGNASGPVPPIDLLSLKGSPYITRPTLFDYIADHTELQSRVDDLFSWISSGKLKVFIDKEFTLEEAGIAHAYIEQGHTTGKVVINI